METIFTFITYVAYVVIAFGGYTVFRLKACGESSYGSPGLAMIIAICWLVAYYTT